MLKMQNEYEFVYCYQCLQCGRYLGTILKSIPNPDIRYDLQLEKQVDNHEHECYCCENIENFEFVFFKKKDFAIRELINLNSKKQIPN